MTARNSGLRYAHTASEAFKDADYAGCIQTPDSRVIGFHGAMRPPRRRRRTSRPPGPVRTALRALWAYLSAPSPWTRRP